MHHVMVWYEVIDPETGNLIEDGESLESLQSLRGEEDTSDIAILRCEDIDGHITITRVN